MRLNKINRQGSIGYGSRNNRGWTARYTNNDDVLFFAETSNIADGKLYNQKTGATDYLTVGGTEGSYIFQCPDSAPYIAADTDFIWFEVDETPRTVLEAELIDYDLQRTPVGYLDDDPNSLFVIMILSSELTGDRLNMMFRDFRLHPLWNDNWNDNGFTKSNRGLEQILYTP